MCYLRQIVYVIDICGEPEGALSAKAVKDVGVAKETPCPVVRQQCDRRHTESFWTEWQLSDGSGEADFPPRQ